MLTVAKGNSFRFFDCKFLGACARAFVAAVAIGRITGFTAGAVKIGSRFELSDRGGRFSVGHL